MNDEITEQPMRVVVDITRPDVFFLGLHVALRLRLGWAVCAIFFVVSLWGQWQSEYRPTNWTQAVYVIAAFGAIFFGLFLAVTLFIAILGVFSFSAMPGVLGSHAYEIRPDGLFESTSANQTLTSWWAIARAIRTHRYIFVSLSRTQLHVIPRRAFPDSTACDAFLHALQQRISQSAEPV